MKKVLYVATVLSHICQFHLPYLKMFQDRGYEVHVAARDNLAEKNGMKLQNTDKYFDVPFCRSPFSFKNMKAYKQFKSILRENYDIIVCNTPVGGIVARLAGEKYRRKGTKIIYIAHGFHFYKGGPKKNWVLYYPVEKFFAKRCDVLVTINKEDFPAKGRNSASTQPSDLNSSISSSLSPAGLPHWHWICLFVFLGTCQNVCLFWDLLS